MIYNLILAAVLMVAFFMCISAYSLGLKHGKMLANKEVPTVQVNPVKAVINAYERHEAKEEQKQAADDLNTIMNVTRESMLENMAKGVR